MYRRSWPHFFFYWKWCGHLLLSIQQRRQSTMTATTTVSNLQWSPGYPRRWYIFFYREQCRRLHKDNRSIGVYTRAIYYSSSAQVQILPLSPFYSLHRLWSHWISLLKDYNIFIWSKQGSSELWRTLPPPTKLSTSIQIQQQHQCLLQCQCQCLML